MSENTSPAAPVPASSTQGAKIVDPLAKPGETPVFSSNTTISSMADLNTKAPELAEAMKMGIAMQITQQMERHGKRMKELMQKQRYGG